MAESMSAENTLVSASAAVNVVEQGGRYEGQLGSEFETMEGNLKELMAAFNRVRNAAERL